MSTNAETAGGGSEVTQRRRVVDDDRAALEFGWRPEVPIAAGLKRTVGWLRARGLILGLTLAAACARGPSSSRRRPSPSSAATAPNATPSGAARASGLVCT